MQWTFDRLKLLGWLLVLLTAASLVTHVHSAELSRILDALPQTRDGLLTGYKVTAIETNIIFSRVNPTAKPSMQTNVCAYVYRFGDGVISISCKRLDINGKLTKESNTFITDHDIWEHNNSHEEGAASNAGSSWGRVEPRGTSILFGVPAFLSKAGLHDFIKRSPKANVEIGNSSKAYNCYIVKLSTPPGSPVETYKLFLSFDTLMPVEFNSYLPDGTACSLTELQFQDAGNSPFACKRAEAKIFSEGVIIMQSTWINLGVERDALSLRENLESFFPPQTRVSDRRFNKPIAYHMGRRLPTSNEIQLMLTTSNGVAKYEAATSSGIGPSSTELARSKSSWPTLTLVICLILGPVIWWAFAQKKPSKEIE